MPLDNDTTLKVFAGLAVIIAALISAVVGLYTQLKVKQFELRAQTTKERSARRAKYHLPLLKFAYELDGRIGRILDVLPSDWLSGSYLERIRKNEGFAKSPLATGYFIMSSVYVFACFFGWTEAIKKGLDATQGFRPRSPFGRWLSACWWGIRKHVFRSQGGPTVFFFDPDIGVVRRLFQYQELFKSYSTSRKLSNPRDAYRLHRHLQHSIGEMMLQADGDLIRCKTFREFYDAYREVEQFRYWFIPLEELLVDLSGFEPAKDVETQAEMKNDIRPLRLLAIRYWCRIMMKNLARELGIETPQPDEVLKGLSDSLKAAITSVRIEQLEAYLAGGSLKR